MEEEITRLKAELEEQRSRCRGLENDLDDMALDNDRLNKLLALAGGGAGGNSATTFKSRAPPASNSSEEEASDGSSPSASGTSSDTAFEWRDLLVDGDDSCTDLVPLKIKDGDAFHLPSHHIALLLLSILVIGLGSTVPATHEAFACGGADNTLTIYGTPPASGPLSHGNNSADNEGEAQQTGPRMLRSYGLSAPVLCLDSYGPYVACSLMDGGHAVIDVSGPDPSIEDSASTASSVTLFKEHSKYVVSIKWSPDGMFLATVSHDKSVNLFKKSLTEKGELLLLKVHTARFMVTPECAVFVKSSGATSTEKHGNGTTAATATDTSDIVSTTLSPNSKVDSGSQRDVKMDLEGGGEGEREWELVIALRDTPHLTYLNARTFEQRFISLNEADWDTHCSFTPLHLAVSPNLKYLLVATDKNFHFITAIGASKRLRILAGGHTCGDFGKPKASFDSTGKYVYCNNEDGSGVCVYSISTEKPVRFLTAHHGLVRDVVCHPSLPLLVTGSHDKSVILWTATKL